METIVEYVRNMKYVVSIRGQGVPLLLLHGFTGSRKSWSSFMEQMQGRYRCIAPDLPGHGDTDAPLDASRYAMAETVHDLALLLRQLGVEQCGVIGYSMGGRIGLSFALAACDRVLGLILESASPGLVNVTSRLNRMEQDVALAKRIETIGVHAFASEWANLPLFKHRAHLSAMQLEDEQEIRRAQRAHGLAESLRGIGTGAQPSNWAALPSLAIPTLLLTGQLDEKFTQIASEMAKQLPNGTQRIIPQSGHTIHLEQPNRFIAEVNRFFLGLVTWEPIRANNED